MINSKTYIGVYSGVLTLSENLMKLKTKFAITMLCFWPEEVKKSRFSKYVAFFILRVEGQIACYVTYTHYGQSSAMPLVVASHQF